MDDMRNMILVELIDKMHERLADKAFPPDPSKDDQPAVTGITELNHTEDGAEIPAVMPPAVEAEKKLDKDSDADEPTDDELEEMLKG